MRKFLSSLHLWKVPSAFYADPAELVAELEREAYCYRDESGAEQRVIPKWLFDLTTSTLRRVKLKE